MDMVAKKELIKKATILLDADIVNLLILRKTVGMTYSDVIRELLKK